MLFKGIAGIIHAYVIFSVVNVTLHVYKPPECPSFGGTVPTFGPNPPVPLYSLIVPLFDMINKLALINVQF